MKDMTEEELEAALARLENEKRPPSAADRARIEREAGEDTVRERGIKTQIVSHGGRESALSRAVAEKLHQPFTPAQREKALDTRKSNTQREREAKITELLEKDPSCTCGIRPDMTARELRAVKSCKRSFVCGTLDRVRIATKMWDQLSREQSE